MTDIFFWFFVFFTLPYILCFLFKWIFLGSVIALHFSYPYVNYLFDEKVIYIALWALGFAYFFYRLIKYIFRKKAHYSFDPPIESE
jgi:hypothetical protein